MPETIPTYREVFGDALQPLPHGMPVGQWGNGVVILPIEMPAVRREIYRQKLAHRYAAPMTVQCIRETPGAILAAMRQADPLFFEEDPYV